MADRIGVQIRRGTVGPMAVGGDPGDAFIIALLAERGPVDTPTLITSMPRFEAVFGGATPFPDGTRYSDGYEVLRVFFAKSGRRAVVTRIAGSGAVVGEVDLNNRQTTPEPTLKVKANGPGSWANGYSVRIADGTRASTFRLTVVDTSDALNPVDVEEFDNLTMTNASLARVNEQSDFVRVEDLGSTAVGDDILPAAGTFVLDSSVAGVDANSPSEVDVIGAVAVDGAKSGLQALRDHRLGRGFICAPGLDEGSNRQAVSEELTAIGQEYFRLYFTSADEGTTVATVGTQRAMLEGYNVGFYMVRPTILDGHSGELKTFSQAGHIVADYLKALETKGPGKAPAGGDFRIDRVRGVETRQNGAPLVDPGIAEELMSQNINPIWDRDGTGPKVWGARAATDDPAWRFLHVGYLYNLIASQVQEALDRLVYENASDPLFFAQLRLGLRGFMIELHGQGAFDGEIPGDAEEPNPEVHAFAVQADPSLLSPQDKESGTVRARIEFKPALTAETIIVDVAKRNQS